MLVWKAMLSDDANDVFHAPRDEASIACMDAFGTAHCSAALLGKVAALLALRGNLAGGIRPFAARCWPVAPSRQRFPGRLLAWSSVRAARSCALAEMRAVAWRTRAHLRTHIPITARKLTCTCHTLRRKTPSTCG